MANVWKEYLKAKSESDRVTNEVLHEINKKKLINSSGEAFIQSILSGNKSSKK